MSDQPALRDERTVAVENASYRLAFAVVTFGMLAIAAVRALVLHQALLDVLALVIVGSGVATYRQWRQRILSRRWWLMGLAIALLGAAIAAAVAVLLGRYWHR